MYTACLDLLPHKKFTFAKIWIMLSHFEIRQKNLQAARKAMVNIFIVCLFFPAISPARSQERLFKEEGNHSLFRSTEIYL